MIIQPNNKLTLSPKNKLYLRVLIMVISLLIAAGGYLFYNQQEKSIRQEKYNDLKAIADLKVSQIENWLHERNADAIVASHSPFFIDAVALWLQDTTNVVLKDDIIERLKLFQEEYEYEDIFLAATNGQSLLSAKGITAIYDSITIQKTIEASVKKETVFTDFYFCTYHNKIHFDIITPVINRDNKTIAVLILRRHPNDFLYPLIQNWPTPSKSAESAILRVENDSVVYLNELRHRKNAALKLKIPLTRTEVPAVQAALGRSGLFEGIDYRGVEVLSDIRTIPGVNWIMLSKVDKSEIYADLNLTAGIITGFTILLVIICALGFVYIYNSRQKNIFKELFIKEKELWKQREQFEITLNNLGDGVMALDTKGNIQYMNNRAEELTGWKLKEARGKDFHDVYNVINEETGLAENNILDKVIKHGIVKELGNHTLLISKSGIKIPVMDTGAPVFDTNGTLTGIAIAFQDETEKRYQQKLLKESESRLRSAFDNMLEGCQIIGHDWRYLYLNNAAEANNRRPKTELLGNKYMDMWPGIETTEVFRIIKRCMEERIAHQMNNEFTFPDGTEGWFNLNIEPVPEGILILSEDITKQKLVEEERKEFHQRIEKIAELIPGMIYQYRLNPDGTSCFPWSSAGTTKIYGVKPEDVERDATPVFNVLHPDDQGRASKTINESAKNLTIWNDEYRVNLPNGKTIWVEGTATPQKQEDGSILWHGAILDITGRKQAEEEIKESRSKLQLIFETMTDGLVVIDSQGRFIQCNPVALSILGLTEDQFMGRTATDPRWKSFREDGTVFPFEEQPGIVALRTGKEKSDLINLELPSGEHRWISVKANPYNSKGKSGDKGSSERNVLVTFVDITARKLAEEKLRESNERFDRLVSSLDDVVWTSTPDGTTLLDMNSSFEKVYGITVDEFKANPELWIEMVHPDDRQIAEASGKELYEIGKAEAEYRIVKPDGTIVWLLDRKLLIYDANGKAVQMGGIAKDITERKLAEEKLLHTEKRFRSLIEQGNDIIALINETGELKYASPNVNKILGYSEEKFVGANGFYFIHDEDIEKVQKLLTELLTKPEEPVLTEFRFRCKDGSYRWFELFGINQLNNPDLKAIVTTSRDITERKKADDLLRESQELFRRTLELGVVGMATTHPYSYYFLSANQRLCEMVGYTEEELLQMTWVEITFPKEKVDEDTANVEKLLSGEHNGYVMEKQYRHKDGHMIDITLSVQGLRKNDGTIDYILILVDDITEQKRNENFIVTQRNLGITTSAITNLEELYRVSTESLFNLSGMECMMIYLFDEEQKKLDRVYSEGLSEQFVSVTSHYDEHSDNVKFVKLGKPAFVNYNELPVELGEIEQAEKLVSVAILPIVNKGKVIGCINLASHQSISMPVTLQKGIEVIVTLISNAIVRIKAEDEIRDLNTTLEIKVDERTGQLAETNRNLYQEIEIRTKAHEEVDRLHQQMDYIFGATKTGLSIVDEDYNLYHVSPAQQKIYGDFSGKKCYEYFKEFDEPCEECLIKKAIETQTSAVYETTYPRENNRSVQATTIPFIDKNGKQLVAEVTVDITERKKIEQLLAEAKTEAERANVAKSEFLSRMSHELRTPMNSILGFAQLLNRSEPNPERKKRINQIMNSGMHLLDLINEVLDLARIESGKLSLSLEPVQLSGIIMESLDIVHPIAEKRDIKIELADSPVNNLFVKSDRQKLKQVMLNLINNAVKYNRKGGEVEVGITQTGNSIRISVHDTGIGIAPEEIHKLFEPFQRIGSEISEVEGTGLGLAVAKKLVEALNGIIGVESVVGVGSTFWIELPLTESQLEHNVQTRQSAKQGTLITPSSGTILYIEDNFSNIQLVEDILRTERPNIRLVAEMYGKNAVKIATDYKPDFILLDLDLPDIHGSEVLKLLQIEPATKSIPVVVLSADAMTYMIEQLMAAGARHYLTKPIDVVGFLEVVDEIMNKG